jgi:hypothetical protein
MLRSSVAPNSSYLKDGTADCVAVAPVYLVAHPYPEGRPNIMTHGTRSAYNKGCRCDMCRETSRLARARQREIARTRDAAESTDAGVAPPWVVVAGLAGGGVFCLWRGWRIKAEDPETRVTRRR